MTRAARGRRAARPGAPLDDLEALAPLAERIREQAARLRAAAEDREIEARRSRHEADEFRAAVAGAVPLRPSGRIAPQRRPVPADARQRELDERAVLEASLSDEIGIEQILETDDALSYHRSGVGADVVRRLRRGQWTVRGQIDLHGLRVDEAREALNGFLDDAMRREWRCVRVIHGKGLGSIGREPVLKGKVPRWLVQRQHVLAFCQARPNDGGGGALIVLLAGTKARSD